MSQTAVAPHSFHADISRIVRYAPAELIGREVQTKLLSDAWDKVVLGETQRSHVLSFVALGGEGKTSLVAKWAADLAHRGWPACEAVFAWSFYHQGSDEKTADSSDLFLKEALTVFGDPALANSAQGAFDKGRRLAQLVGERRALLILDGVEPLQYAPTSPTPGELKDAGLAALLKGLAANNHGLCVVTTRYAIPDLRAWWQTTAPQTRLLRLSEAAGVALLRSLGVKGKQPEFEKLVEDVQGHALTLNLLGSYLHEAHAGDIRKRDLVKLEEADDEQGGHAFRVMDAYVSSFEREGEKGKRAVAVLRLLGLFDRPASADCIAALLKAPAIPGLTEALVGTSEAQRNVVFSRLEAARLLTVNRNAASALLALDAHPLLRDYFARHVHKLRPDAVRIAHRRLYQHLTAATKDLPEPTLEDLQPLYQAVAHGCLAGAPEDACEKVYIARILRKNQNYSTKKLGAFASDLGAVACFFEEPWSRVSNLLSGAHQAWLLNQAVSRLRALGRLSEAIEPMQAALKSDVEQERWKEAATSAGNLSELELTLGNLDESVVYSEQALNYGDRRDDLFQRMLMRTIHADALHQSGRRAEAHARFREAEDMQSEDQPKYPILYSMRGYRYCDLLLCSAERVAWQYVLDRDDFQAKASSILPSARDAIARKTLPPDADSLSYGLQTEQRSGHYAPGREIESCRAVSRRTAKMFEWRVPMDPLLDIALDHLSLGRATLYKAILQRLPIDACHSPIGHAVSGLRHAGQQQYLPLGLLTRAWLRAHTGTPTGPESAQSDLDEAWEIAERGPMPLFLADIHLHRARLFGGLSSEADGATYPWQSPAADLAAARRLIEKHGYGRRVQELGDAQAALSRPPE